MIDASIFRAYDIRGVYPGELDEDVAYAVAQAYAKVFAPRTVVVGRDVRLSSPALWEAAARGFTDHGVDVVDIGMITTDMMYFASAAYDHDGGIMISASHNPPEYNGMKLIRRGAVAVSGETGIAEIRDLVRSGYRHEEARKGTVSARDISADYDAKCLSFIDRAALAPCRVVANAMFGPVLRNVARLGLPIEVVPLNGEPDGSFPKGPPNPLLPENQAETAALVRSAGADLGVAWDGDADRFFVFDERGEFVPAYFLTALFGEMFARREPGARVLRDPRLTWAVDDAVHGAGGVPVPNRSGHSFMKDGMRRENAVFGGETSGHYFFRDFYYADNGLIPFLLFLELWSRSGSSVSALFAPYRGRYFISGELNRPLPSPAAAEGVLAAFRAKYADARFDDLDGLSIEYPDWRANVRASNTEPLLRVNVEARDRATLEARTADMLSVIEER